MYRLGFLGLVSLILLAGVIIASPQSASAMSIAIINGASGTSEADTTAAITSNLNSLVVAAGHTTTVLDGVPGILAGYGQVWDIRFDNNLSLTAAVQAQYLSYLQGGGGMFVMGENSSFMTRNNSVLSLVTATGGGSLSFITPASTQTVVSPFTGPNVIADGNVTYSAPGGVTSAGTGQYITVDGSGYGTGVAFGVGDMSNASLGALTMIFDVNFMQATFDQPDSQDLLKNLITFVEEEVDDDDDVIPEPMTMLAVFTGVCGLGGYIRKRRTTA